MCRRPAARRPSRAGTPRRRTPRRRLRNTHARRAKPVAGARPQHPPTAAHALHFSVAGALQFTHCGSSFGGGGAACSTSSTSFGRRRTGGPRLPSSAMVRNLPSRPGGTRVPRDLHLRRRMRASLEGAMRGAQARSSLGVMGFAWALSARARRLPEVVRWICERYVRQEEGEEKSCEMRVVYVTYPHLLMQSSAVILFPAIWDPSRDSS